jgi:hypothetical protein
VPECQVIIAGINTLDLGFFVQWPTIRLHCQLEKYGEEAAGTDGFQLDGWECLVLPSGKNKNCRDTSLNAGRCGTAVPRADADAGPAP